VDQETPTMFIIQQVLFPTQVLNFLVFCMQPVTCEILLHVDRPLGISTITHDLELFYMTNKENGVQSAEEDI
jgi:hypothetical protein